MTKSDIEKYFTAEKQESFLFLVIGLIAIGFALYFFFFQRMNFYKVVGIPLLLVGLIQVVVGYTVYARSDSQMAGLVQIFGEDPGKFANAELPRMKVVNKNFVVYRWVEIGLACVAVVLILLFRTNDGRSFWFGVGFGLLLQSLLMLGADYFAQRRAQHYTNKFENLKSL